MSNIVCYIKGHLNVKITVDRDCNSCERNGMKETVGLFISLLNVLFFNYYIIII